MRKENMDYYQINRISNSDLSKFKSEVILGKEFKRPEKAFNFGNAFHALLLEPHLPIKSHSSVNYCLVNKLVEKVRNESCCNWHLMNGRKEQVILFEDATTQAKCKAKLDVVTGSLDGEKRMIMDFKTTQVKDYAAF